MTYVVQIIIALLAFAGTAIGAFAANRKTSALVVYRLEQLEKKVDLHNSVISRTYDLEARADVMEEKLKVANNRLKNLEGAK